MEITLKLLSYFVDIIVLIFITPFLLMVTPLWLIFKAIAIVFAVVDEVFMALMAVLLTIADESTRWIKKK